MNLDELLNISPYSLDATQKEEILSDLLSELTKYHYDNCVEYKKILDILNFNPEQQYSTVNLPFIPVRLFKEFDLCSVDRKKITKTLTSSGTSGQQVSKILLDANNVKNQTKVLNSIISSFIGKQRLPLLLLDTEYVKKDRKMYSARGAGITGFTLFGRDTTFALNENMEIDIEKVKAFFEKHKDEKILMFGYTYMIWQFIVIVLKNKNIKFQLKDAILFHIGGWKKLKDLAVSTQEFNSQIKECLGNVKVYNYYGMAEQLGSVFVECEHGNMHCSIFSDVIIRNHKDFSERKNGEKGLIDLLSVLPTSYPGHILLTEDEGVVLGVDSCPCGRKGKFFKILGRIKKAELRGCSDTYEQH